MKQAIDIAITQLGICETTGKNDGIPAKRYMRGDELAWCAGFLLFCNEESDDPDITPDDWTYYALRSVKTFQAHLEKHGCFLPRDYASPGRNDFIIFGGTASDVNVKGHHIGIVEKVENGRVHTVEGNTSNKVARRSYDLKDKTILGYGRVKPELAKIPAARK